MYMRAHTHPPIYKVVVDKEKMFRHEFFISPFWDMEVYLGLLASIDTLHFSE